MKCCKCGKGVFDGVALHRVNEVGVSGIWECDDCVDVSSVDPVVLDIVRTVQGKA